MTYAIIESGNKQYWVSAGDEILIEKLLQTEGSVEIREVLLISDKQGKVSLGTPYVTGHSVKATVLGQEKSKKTIAFKFKRKTGYHKTIGHRQVYSRIKIEEIAGA